MMKKILPIFLLVQFFCSYVLQLALISTTYAAGIDLYEQKVSTDISSAFSNPTDSLAVAPDQEFRFESKLQNNQTSNITNVSYYTNFPSNIIYSGTTRAATQVNGASTFVVPITSFNPPTILPNYLNGLVSLSPTSNYAVRRIILKFPANQSVYQNVLSSYFTADGGLTSNTRSTIVYVNVKPHIVDYSFSKSSIVGNGTDSVDLTVKVKDYNGCGNINSNNLVTVNATSLGLSSTEALTYDSCDADGKTAIFKKTGITTLAGTGDKTFSYNSFAAKDKDDNITDPSDIYFGGEDKKSDLVLTVATPVAPVVTIASLTPAKVSLVSGFTNSTLSFSADKAGTYKVVANGNGSCSVGIVLTDWTNYSTGDTINQSITSSGLLDGVNTLYACAQNSVGDIGSANVILSLDTVAPIASSMNLTPGAVVTNNATGSVYCSEDGQYKFSVGSNSTSYAPSVKDIKNEALIQNAWLSLGDNAVTAYCRDGVGNESTTMLNLVKEALPPSMSSSGVTLIDNDVAWDGVDGRDLRVTWDSTIGANYSSFGSYQIYILPSGSSFTGVSVGAVFDKTVSIWTGSNTVVNDSLGNPLTGGEYTAYVAIMGLSLNVGNAASATGTLVADVIPHPSVISATFTSTGNLRVKFDTNLKTDTGSHSATGFVYEVAGITYTGSSITSVSGDALNISIPDLGNTAATGTLSVMTGAAWGVPVDGSFNYGTGGVIVSDAIFPSVTNFATGTIAHYENFYSGSLVFDYTISENITGAGDSKIVFTRVGGNIDTLKNHFITTPANLLAGAHSEAINLSSLGLVSGAYYDVTLVAKDLAGNITTSAPISIKFDSIGPNIVSITPFGPQGILGVVNPTFAWLSTTDNSGNGSGVKGYKLRVYTGSTVYSTWHSCTGSYTEQDIASGAILSRQITLANLYNYAWSLTAYDQMENIGTASSCDTFYINTNIPSFSLTSITDTVLNSTTYTKGGNNLVIKSTITNTDSGHIWLAANSLKDSSYASISCASPVSGVTCTYASNIATYTFVNGALASLSSGVKQVQFTATNIAGINTGSTLASITLDNAPPTIGASTLLSPISGIYGGTGIAITWTPGNITDNIGVAYTKLDYTNDGTNWTTIGTGANSGSYPWNITALTSGAFYQVRISAYDGVGQSSTYTGSIFSIDKVAPVVSSSALIYPSASGIKAKGGTTMNITWTPGSITDNIALATNPITLSYSLDGGTNYSQIANALPNTGSYTWNVPNALNNANMKIKIEAVDNVGNITNDVSDNVFEVDSTAPAITISYAGAGGSTPQTNAYINNSGFDISASITDNNLGGGMIYYSFYDQTTGKYWNGTTYTGSTEIWNTLATATGSSYNLATTITPSVTNGDSYKLKLKSDDGVGNSTTTTQITYAGDTINPTLAITTESGTYLNNSLTITGTAADTGSTLSSISIEIQNGSNWWNGTNWVASEQLLAVTTANNYANWSYVFNPIADSSGQNYIITAHAYDRAYKTNNTTIKTITATKDTSGPIIAPGVFTNVISGIQKDGNVINITWDTGAITSTGALVNPNGIILKFNNGAGIVTITGATANDGSYSYTLPTGDTQNAFFVIEATDTLGNLSNTVASSGFSLDSTPPTISSVETREDTLGQINGVNIYFSELINHSSIHLNDFNISGVANMQTGAISDVGSGTIFTINFTSTGTTGTTPNMTYTAGSLTDLSGKPLATVTKPSVDKARPLIISADVYDTNNNGKIDRIIATLSENVGANTDASSWTLSNLLPGVSISTVSVTGNTAILTLTEPTSPNTSTGGMTLSFANNGSWKDSTNNLMSDTITPLALGDKAPPIKLSATTKDSDGNSKMDHILLTFSENITGAIGSDFGVIGLSTGATFSNSITSSGNTISLYIGETSSDNDTGIIPSYSYSGTSVKDASNNVFANITSTPTLDGIVPKILTRSTLDQNGNGHIDTLKLTMSETISGTGGIIVSVGGYTTNGYTLCAVNALCIGVEEKATYDGDQTPTVQITSNTTLGDTSNNIIPTDVSPVTSADGVGPIIVGARYDAGATGGVNDDVIYLTFSESLSGATIDTANATTDFNVLGGGSLTSATVTNISGNTAEIHLGASSTALTVGVSEISIKTGAISDTLSNPSPTEGVNNRVTVNASVVINEVMFSSVTADQYIELRNLGSTSVSLSGWTIANAGGVTLPAGASIAGNGYYLIANSASASSILAGTPDLIAPSLSLAPTTQSDLILKNAQNVTFDSTKASPWPAGNSTNEVAMERMNFPGDGLLGANWYSSVVSVGFDTTIPKGTPGTANVFDSSAPVIDSVNVADNTLFPLGNISLVYNYSDNVAINATSRTFTLEKWDGTSWTDITTGNISSSGGTLSQATYATNTLTFGKYRSTFSISDTALNSVSKVNIFYVDKFEMTLSAGSVDIGVLSPGNTTFATPTVTVIIKTVGAGFDLSLGGSGSMNAGVAQMSAWNGTKGYGFDWTESGSGNVRNLAGTLTAISPTAIATYNLAPDVNGNQKTYIYTIKYGAKIDSVQTAGLYQSLSRFGVNLRY